MAFGYWRESFAMELLPCLRWSTHRWWLPLDGLTANVVATVLLDVEPDRSSPDHFRLVQERLVRDPAFLIFVALRYLESGSSPPPDRSTEQSVTVSRLTEWFVGSAAMLFSSADRQFAAPPVTAATREAWRQQVRHCQTLPVETWLSTAPQWLAITGPEVPLAWQATWPTIRLEVSAGAPAVATKEASPEPLQYAVGTLSLVRLAQRMRQERQLREAFDHRLQTEKLASLKQFAYGLTHEINNPLANIVTRSEQLQSDEPDEPRRASLQRVMDQAMRAHEMLSDVMFFAHPPQPDCQAFDLAELVDELLTSYRTACAPQQITLRSLSSQSLVCVADRQMLHDALDALLRNAVEAIGEGGQIVVRYGQRGQRVLMSVSDSGPGLTEEARRHAFDPYYSGREAGRGLGLGLCRVYRIAKLHGGGASISSAVAGCVARLWFRLPTP